MALWLAAAFLQMAFNETIGEFVNFKIGPKTLTLSACDPAIRNHHLNKPDHNDANRLKEATL